jgi:formate hydrogenlyase subunit 3/multisubunit Na+/H+ antiporter MnhD subunit
VTACAIAIVVLAVAAVAALAANTRPRVASGIAAGGAIVAAALGVPPAIAVLAGGDAGELDIAWAPPLGHVHLGLDPLSAFFVVPLLVIGATCAVYGAFYLDDQRDRRALGPPACSYALLIAAMLLVLLARDAIVFLIGWEVMTLASYLLVSFDHHEPDVRRAGWIYLIAAHLGLACVLAMFVSLGRDAGGFDFSSLTASPAGGAAGAIALVLALLGFGVKAGIVPLHVWLPEAHAAAPSHVSALMSAVLIKLGVYGILRTRSFVEPIAWAGPVLAAVGVVTAIVGISLALYQRDLKRALAYSSIENVGVIFLGLGVGLWGASSGHPAIAALGVFGGLFHLWNHALMKGLLFLGAGSVLHGAGTRDVEQLGGLLRRMPRTGTLVIVGAVAIAALPPLAGFASEWLIYRGLLDGGVGRGAGEGLAMLFGTAVLATVGVLAALCFVRLAGVALLGAPRSARAADAHESPRGMIAPMIALAAGAIAMPLAAPWLVAAIAPAADQIAGAPLATAPVADVLAPIAIGSAALWIALAIAAAALARLARRSAADETWGCGYAAPTARMQYTGSSFSDTLERLLPGRLRPHVAVKRAAEPFPAPGALSSDRRDPFTRAAYEPVLDRLARRFAQLRWVQQGHLHLYLVYIVATVVGALAAVSLYDLWGSP